MNQHRTILAAIDLTEEAPEVIDAAAAAAGDGELHLLTVIRPLTQAYTGLEFAGMAATALNFEKEAETHAKAALAKLAAAADVPDDRQQIIFGAPAAEIKNHAEAIGADLIVVGSHGRHGLGLLLGSTANAVLHAAPCDVLTVRISEDKS